MTKKQAKPVRAWAVVTPPDRVITRTITETRADAIWTFTGGVKSRWPEFQKEGYRLARVLVTEERK